jgi:hypothetical protein
LPASLIASVFVPEVPMSIPKKTAMSHSLSVGAFARLRRAECRGSIRGMLPKSTKRGACGGSAVG